MNWNFKICLMLLNIIAIFIIWWNVSNYNGSIKTTLASRTLMRGKESNGLSKEENDIYQVEDMNGIQERKVQYLQKMCSEFRNSEEYKHLRLTEVVNPKMSFISFPNHQTTTRALWCPGFKAGHKSWLRTFKRLKANYSKFEFDLRENMNKSLVTVRFLNVRNPWERLLSAYIDRMTYHKYRKEKSWQRDNIGRHIMDTYYPASDAMNVPYVNINFTFKDFLRFIIEEPQQYYGRMDRHWLQFYKWCKPCDPYIDYNVIVKLETVTKDSNYILKKIGVETKIADGPRQTVNYIKEYYKDIPKWMIDKLMKIYYWDFKLFEYDFDSPI